jgi:hypothetical protein
VTEPPTDQAGDRLRDAYRAVVEAVQPDDIGDLPPAHPQPLLRGRPRKTARWTRRLAPLAAAAAVVLAIGLAIAVPRLSDHGTTPAAVTTTGAGQPPFLVDLDGASYLYLKVRDAATGRVLAQLKSPGQGMWQIAEATGSPVKFVVGVAHDQVRGLCSSQDDTQLYTLTLTTAGTPASLTPLYRIPAMFEGSVPFGSRNALAVSADGRTVAYAAGPCGHVTSSTQMSIVVIRDGVSRTWTTPRSMGPTSLSLSADGSELGYADVGQYQWPISAQGSAWILPTDSPPGSAERWSRKLFANVPGKGIQLADEELSPDGAVMYIVTATSTANPSQPTTDALYAYSTATGARSRTLHTWAGIQQGPPSLTIGGNDALIWDMYNWVAEVNLTTGAARMFTQLPHSANQAASVFDVAW